MSPSTFLPKGYSKLTTKERHGVVQEQINKVGMKDTFADFAKIARYRTNTASGPTYQHDLNHLMASLLPQDCPDDYIFSILTNKCIRNNKKNRETQAAIKADLRKLPVLFKEKDKKQLPSNKKKASKKKLTTPFKKVRMMEDELTHLKSVMLADTFVEAKIASLVFPVYVSTKIDGHRSMRVADRLVSRGMSDIPNVHIRNCLTRILASGMDLELIVNNDLQETSKIVRHRTRTVEQLDVYILDWVTDSDLKNKVSFSERYARLEAWYKQHSQTTHLDGCEKIKIHLAEQKLVHDAKALKAAYVAAEKKGEEGIMIRDPEAPYSQSRSKGLLKWKRWSDAEGKIVNVVIEPGATRIKAFNIEWNGALFKISSGLNSRNAADFYKQRASLKGKLAKFKYQDISRDGILKKGAAPRHAIFLDIRDEADLS